MLFVCEREKYSAKISQCKKVVACAAIRMMFERHEVMTIRIVKEFAAMLIVRYLPYFGLIHFWQKTSIMGDTCRVRLSSCLALCSLPKKRPYLTG